MAPRARQDGATEPIDSLDRALRAAEEAVSNPPTDQRILAAVESQLFTAPMPERLGRYRVIERLGAGGMGVVFRGHDPELDRDVAIKLLHPHAATSESARTRLQQEARSLAEVSHPNVVQIYDVGKDGSSVFLSMELVVGIDLRHWLEAEPRPWTETLAMFIEAGRGLAAAHERGMVHRDFKPGNVLVGDDGRVRVVDFGLACLADSTATAPRDVSSVSGLRSGTLTETGVALGTPAYMAPEQHRGKSADTRCDQYSFCLALYEGLVGHRPFSGSTVQDLMLAKEQGPPRSPAVKGPVRALLAVARRGLHPEPHRRWPDMNTLLRALTSAARPRRRRGQAVVLAGLLGGGGLVTAYALGADDPRDAAHCPSAEQRLEGVWDSTRSQDLHQALRDSGMPYAEETWDRIEPRLDDYASAWGERYEEVCAAMHQTATPPRQATLDERMMCLGARRDELAGVVDVLIHDGRETGGAAEGPAPGVSVQHAVATVAGLRPLSGCDASTPATATAELDEAWVEEVRRDLLKAESLGKVAHFDEGLALALPALARVQQGPTPLKVEAALIVGRLRKGKGEAEVAQTLLSEAAHDARAIGRDDLAARAAIELVDVLGAWRSRYDDAIEWGRHARAAIERMDDPPPLHARLESALGDLELTLGHVDAALAHFEKSLALAQQAFGDGHPTLAAAQSDLANALVRAGRFDEALAVGQQALIAGEQAFGPHHPEVGIMHSRLANAWLRQGDYAKSAEHAQRGIDILAATLGPQHPNVVAVMINLAQAEQRRGRLEQAKASYAQALPLLANTPNEAIALAALADISRDMHDYEASLDYAERSRELRESLYGTDDTKVAIGLYAEGLALSLVGRDDDAFDAFDRARSIAALRPLPEPFKVVVDAYEGRAHLYAGRPAEAIDGLRRALERQQALGSEPIDRAEVRFHLVQALWATGHHDEAREQLAEVDRELAPMGDAVEHRRAPIREFIAEHDLDVQLTVEGDDEADARTKAERARP